MSIRSLAGRVSHAVIAGWLALGLPVTAPDALADQHDPMEPPMPAQGILIDVVPAVAALPDTPWLRVVDSWIGLSPAAPLAARYDLERRDDRFEGRGHFSAGGMRFNSSPQETERDILIPAEVAQAVLQRLLETPVEEGTYTPSIRHTDDYPSIALEADAAGELVRFFTRSQGAEHVPWGVETAGRTFVVNSPHVSQALADLDSYLQKDALRQVRDAAMAPPGPR